MTEIRGELGYFGLDDWWIDVFTSQERRHTETIFRPMSVGGGDNRRPLTEAEISHSSGTATKLLSALLGWFKNTEIDRSIKAKIAAKLAEVVEAEPDVLERHFGYSTLIQWNYRERDRIPGAYQAAIVACESQIALSKEAAKAFRKEGFEVLPRHIGFNQLRIIRKKQGDDAAAAAIKARADREGWR